MKIIPSTVGLSRVERNLQLLGQTVTIPLEVDDNRDKFTLYLTTNAFLRKQPTPAELEELAICIVQRLLRDPEGRPDG